MKSFSFKYVLFLAASTVPCTCAYVCRRKIQTDFDFDVFLIKFIFQKKHKNIIFHPLQSQLHIDIMQEEGRRQVKSYSLFLTLYSVR